MGKFIFCILIFITTLPNTSTASYSRNVNNKKGYMPRSSGSGDPVIVRFSMKPYPGNPNVGQKSHSKVDDSWFKLNKTMNYMDGVGSWNEPQTPLDDRSISDWLNTSPFDPSKEKGFKKSPEKNYDHNFGKSLNSKYSRNSKPSGGINYRRSYKNLIKSSMKKSDADGIDFRSDGSVWTDNYMSSEKQGTSDHFPTRSTTGKTNPRLGAKSYRPTGSLNYSPSTSYYDKSYGAGSQYPTDSYQAYQSQSYTPKRYASQVQPYNSQANTYSSKAGRYDTGYQDYGNSRYQSQASNNPYSAEGGYGGGYSNSYPSTQDAQSSYYSQGQQAGASQYGGQTYPPQEKSLYSGGAYGSNQYQVPAQPQQGYYGGGYPPQQGAGYPPQQGAGYPPQQGAGYPPQGAGYPQQAAVHPQQAQGYYPPNQNQQNPLYMNSNPDQGAYFDEEAFRKYLEEFRDSSDSDDDSRESKRGSKSRDYSVESREADSNEDDRSKSYEKDKSSKKSRKRSSEDRSSEKSKRRSSRRRSSRRRSSRKSRPESREWSPTDESASSTDGSYESLDDTGKEPTTATTYKKVPVPMEEPLLPPTEVKEIASAQEKMDEQSSEQVLNELGQELGIPKDRSKAIISDFLSKMFSAAQDSYHDQYVPTSTFSKAETPTSQSLRSTHPHNESLNRIDRLMRRVRDKIQYSNRAHYRRTQALNNPSENEIDRSNSYEKETYDRAA